ncbi:MAG TPA: class I SAM-dependent methyltransferase [Thermoanaerobaculia bacterium]
MIPVFILEEPQYHRLRYDELNRFRGVALAIDTPEIHRVEVFRDGTKITEAEVNLPCPELAGFVQLPRAGTSRFAFDLRVERRATYELRANGETLFIYEPPRDDTRLLRLAEKVATLPVPPPEVVATTQGGGNVESYRDSIVAGVFTSEALLRASGIAETPRAILDLGCGTGRLLAGWHSDDPSRRLAGVDINAELIGWNAAHLANVAEWRVCGLWPPLDFPDGSFDLIQVISVLTHLPLDCQRAWVAEIRRLLRPGGAAMITLHGEMYSPLLLDPSSQELFATTGYVEMAGAAEGANAYSTFHAPTFARGLFAAFDEITWFPRGSDSGVLRWFPVGSLQDVYVLRKAPEHQ